MYNIEEEKLIKKYYLFAKLSLFMLKVFLISFLILALVWVILMINFEGSPSSFSVIVILIYFVISMALFLITVIGMVKKKWVDIKYKAYEKSKSEDVNGFDDSFSPAFSSALSLVPQMKSLIKSIEKISSIGNVKLPNLLNYKAAIILIPILLFIGIDIPKFMDDSIEVRNTLNNKKKAVADVAYKLRDSFSTECQSVSIHDPYERYSYWGYYNFFYLNNNSHFMAYINSDGVIEQISYESSVNVEKNREENIKDAEIYFAIMHDLLVQANVDLTKEMEQNYMFSDEFVEKYLNESNNNQIDIKDNNIRYSYNENSLDITIYLGDC